MRGHELPDRAKDARHARAHAMASLLVSHDRLRGLWKRAEVNIATAQSIVQESRLLLAESERLRGSQGGRTPIQPRRPTARSIA